MWTTYILHDQYMVLLRFCGNDDIYAQDLKNQSKKIEELLRFNLNDSKIACKGDRCMEIERAKFVIYVTSLHQDQPWYIVKLLNSNNWILRNESYRFWTEKCLVKGMIIDMELCFLVLLFSMSWVVYYIHIEKKKKKKKSHLHYSRKDSNFS